LLTGNIRACRTEYHNPTSKEGFAKRSGQNPWMITSVADGAK
jgi:predicted homoserine dehydrogenase-like protein